MTQMDTPQHQETGAETPAMFLGNLTDDQLRQIFAVSEVQTFSAGSVALSEGDTDTSMYIVLEGRAEVSIQGKKGYLSLATLMPGSVFGELAFFDRMPRSARVSVQTDCTVLRISEESFKNLSSQDMGLALALVLELGRVLSLRVRHMNQLVSALSR